VDSELVKAPVKSRPTWLPWLAYVLLLAGTAWQLQRQGRIWWCACGRPFLWSGDIWSAHNSQHLLDPYSCTHLLHGVAFCGLTWLLGPRVRRVWRLWLALLLECGWELLENTPCVIRRYREATLSLGYTGDSIANSCGDIACCALGFLLAARLGLRRSLLFILAVELLLLAWIRDNLTLNILMLIHPVDAIKAWQLGH